MDDLINGVKLQSAAHPVGASTDRDDFSSAALEIIYFEDGEMERTIVPYGLVLRQE